jgi:hypothetical protein
VPARPGLAAALALVVPLAACVLAGCGHKTSPNAAIARYVTRVNRVESALAPSLASVTKVGRELSRLVAAAPAHAAKASSGGAPPPPPASAAVATLDRALAQIEQQRTRLAAVPAPTRARPRRALLIELVAHEATLTDELARLIVYIPALRATLKPLTGAERHLTAALRVTGSGTLAAVTAADNAKAGALQRFSKEAGAVLHRLRRVRAPAVALPGYRPQVSALVHLRTSAGRLARGLRRGASDLARLIYGFETATAGAASRAEQRAQIAAIKAYDAQIAALTTLERETAVARLRLIEAPKPGRASTVTSGTGGG